MEIRELVDKLNEYTKYYDAGNPQISDAEWDEMYFQLQDMENKYGLLYPDSPTQSISYEVVNSLQKAKHNHPMLSLKKTKSIEDIVQFANSNHSNLVAMAKMDGLTCSLHYKDGQLVSAETRGDGKIGEDILHNVRCLPSVPLHIELKSEVTIDGEIVISLKDFDIFKEEYKHPRNFAAGSIRLLDSKECATRQLQFVAWDMIQGDRDNRNFYRRLELLDNLGFTAVPAHPIYSISATNIEKIIDLIKGEEIYPIDGIVFRLMDIEVGNKLGKTDHHFNHSLAFKFADEVYESYLQNIEWTMGRTGVLTPVAIFEPIDIDGCEVTRASMHNINTMTELLNVPYRKQRLEIFRAHQIIPQIKNADKSISEDSIVLTPPKTCPICSGATEILESDSGTVELYCTNPQCEGKLINILDHFCGKKGLDIKGLSKATLEKVIDWGWVSSPIDIFNLKDYVAEWEQMSGFGQKSVSKIISAIYSSRECTLNKFIAALGIPLIGSVASKQLADKFITWEAFIEAVENNYHFYELPNFGIEMNNAILNFDYSKAKEIRKYLEIKVEAIDTNTSKALNGEVFVITGKLNSFNNRDEMKEYIEAHGGKVSSSISSKTAYLVNNDINSTSSKNKKAQELNIPIISETELRNLLEV